MLRRHDRHRQSVSLGSARFVDVPVIRYHATECEPGNFTRYGYVWRDILGYGWELAYSTADARAAYWQSLLRTMDRELAS
jgi:hypothetical protein